MSSADIAAAPARRLVVVHVIGTLGIGGAERQILELIRNLPADRFEQQLALFDREGAFLPELRGVESDVHELRTPGPRSRWWLRRNAERIADAVRFVGYLRRVRPDVLHAQLPAASIAGAIAGRLAGVGVIVTSQLNLCRDRDGRTRRQRVVNRALRSATAVHVNSGAVATDVVEHQDVDPARVEVIHNGVATDRFTPAAAGDRSTARAELGFDDRDRVILCVANLFPFKGHLDLVAAFSRVDPATRDAHLVLVGRDEGTAAEVRRRAAALGLAERVHVVGPTAAVERWYAAADVVAHPSHEEGFSNSILEAMSAGLPVVACSVGGNPEAVVDGETGLLVPARDPDALAAALIDLLDDPATAAAMGRAGRTRVEDHFTNRSMADRFAGFYADLVEARARSHGRTRRTLGRG